MNIVIRKFVFNKYSFVLYFLEKSSVVLMYTITKTRIQKVWILWI